MKKYIEIIAGIALAVLCVVVLFVVVPIVFSRTNAKQTENVIETYQKNGDVEILVYGESLRFSEGVTCEIIPNLEKQQWARENKMVYLFINDIYGNVAVSEEELEFILLHAKNSTNLNVIYFGEKMMPFFSNYFNDSSVTKEDMSYGFIYSEGRRMTMGSMWMKEDMDRLSRNQDLLSQVVELFIESEVKMSIDENSHL